MKPVRQACTVGRGERLNFIKIVGSQPGNWDQGIATNATAGLLTRFGKTIKGIYSHEDAMVAGSIVALERAGMDPSKLAIVSIGCEPSGVSLLKLTNCTRPSFSRRLMTPNTLLITSSTIWPASRWKN